MINRPILGIALLILFSTFISQKKISIDKFKIKEIVIKNNQILKHQELINDFSFLYSKNIVFLNSKEIKTILKKKSFIESFKIKKIYPNKIEIVIEEKKPIAILILKNQKFFLGKKIELIEYRDIKKFKNIPIIYGDNENFKVLFNNLKKINFPNKSIKQYYLFDSGRWDLTMRDDKVIKLPINNYLESLKNFIKIKDNSNYKKYNTFDYRLKNQLILK